MDSRFECGGQLPDNDLSCCPVSRPDVHFQYCIPEIGLRDIIRVVIVVKGRREGIIQEPAAGKIIGGAGACGIVFNQVEREGNVNQFVI